MNLNKFFNPNSVAIVGVSDNPTKVGHIIFQNFKDSEFKGKYYLVNPNRKEILGHKCYSSITKIKEKIDVVVVAVPALATLKVIEDCGKKGIKKVIMITAGFSEVGNFKLENKLSNLLTKYNIKIIGPNCLGIYDAHSKVDSLFLPKYRLKRPGEGGISFICQSGAIGSAILDLATEQGYGFSKFISYGNALNVDESDLLQYLANDKKTKVICLYVEGIKDGKKFLKITREVSKEKPIIIMKGGITEEGSKAALSHTGSLAGSAEIYFGAFKQANVIRAESLEDMFNFARLLENSVKPKGKRVQVITNGGGYGILSSDAIIKNNLLMAVPGKITISSLKKKFPPIVILKNPMDLVGDATTKRYKDAINACMADKGIDILLVIILYQTPGITPEIAEYIIQINNTKKKPLVVVSTGGEFTEEMQKKLERNGVVTYTYPENAIKSILKLCEYNKVN